MHILLYSPQSLPSIGGLQYVVHFWAEELVRRGHTVTLITETPALSPSNSLDDDRPPPGGGGSGLPAGQAGWGLLRRGSLPEQLRALRAADLVLLFNISLKGLPIIMLSALLAGRQGKPIYVTHHTALWYDGGPRPLRQRIKRWVADHLAKKNCACSAYIASLYKKCDVIHSPYRADLFMPGNQPRIPGSILFVGRLVSDKGADLLLEASAILKAKGIGFSLTIVGDGPERQKLIALAEQLNIYINNPSNGSTDLNPSQEVETTSIKVNMATKQDFPPSTKVGAVSFSPPAGGALTQPQLIHLMQTHQIMVVPSRMEPMGMVVAEGLACGCQMVVARQGGLPEVGGPFCTYFESGNAAALADALEQVLTHPLQIDADALHAHLQQFTIPYSVDRLEAWLGG